MAFPFADVLRPCLWMRSLMLAALLTTLHLTTALVQAQDPLDESITEETTETPDLVPRQESVKIEPYSGPPIYLPQPTDPPPAKRVESRTVTEYYDPETEEKPRIKRTVVRFSDDSMKSDGEFQEFYESGQVFVEGQYDLGAPTGEWKYFHPDGSEAKTVNYNAGQPDGDIKLRRPDGTVQAERHFADGKRVGDWMVYGEEGEKPLIESHYNDGQPSGTWQVWYPNGQQRREIPFEDGKQHGTVTEWDEEGIKIAEMPYVKGVREGVARLWNKEGTVVEREYKEGKLVSTKQVEQ